jgi:hypothetical protein
MKKNKILLLPALLLMTTGQSFAHTGLLNKAVTAGATDYNGLTITHGCDDWHDAYKAGTNPDGHKTPYPVIGMVALFPFGSSAVWRNALTNEIVTAPASLQSSAPELTYSLGVTQLTDYSSAFSKATEIVDSLGNVRALKWEKGAMEPNSTTVPKFKMTHPKFGTKCINSVKVRVGVINFCDVNKNMANDPNGPYNAPKDAFGNLVPKTSNFKDPIQQNVDAYYRSEPKGNGALNRADFWFRDLSPASVKWNDPQIIDETGLWSATTVVSPETAATTCPSGAIDYIVEPSGTDFDEILTGPNTRPFTKGNGPF